VINGGMEAKSIHIMPVMLNNVNQRDGLVKPNEDSCRIIFFF